MRLNRKQNLDLLTSRGVTGKDFHLKYLTRHRESMKEAQTDRKIEYGKKREHPRLKNSFKTNSQAGLARSGIRRTQGKPQMLKNMYNRKTTRNTKKTQSQFLDTFKHSESTRNAKKNFVVASGGNGGLDTNFILGHPSPNFANKMMVSGRAVKGSHRNSRGQPRSGMSLGKKMYASPIEKKIFLKMESLRIKGARRLHQSGLESDAQRRLPARGLQGMHKGLFSGGMRKGFHGDKNSHHFKKQSSSTMGFKGLTKSYNFSNPGLFKKNSFKQEH